MTLYQIFLREEVIELWAVMAVLLGDDPLVFA
jgi:hypothetical protein